MPLASISTLFSSPIFSNTDSQVELPAMQSDTMQISKPQVRLIRDSVRIGPIVPQRNKWTDEDRAAAYLLTLKLAQVWDSEGMDYLRFRKITSCRSLSTCEMVPYAQKSWAFPRQLQVWWRVFFGPASYSQYDSHMDASKLKVKLGAKSTYEKNDTVGHVADCVFCDASERQGKAVETQRVFQGRFVNVLFTYTPIGLGKDKFDFLITPKEHRTRLSDLTKEEFLEIENLNEGLVSYFQRKGIDTAYIMDKSGKAAGQTQIHFHERAVFVSNKAEEIFGKLIVLKNMLFGTSPMKGQALASRVKELTGALEPFLTTFMQKKVAQRI